MQTSNTMTVPHLTTALREPLHRIEQHILQHQVEIESWFRKKWHTHTSPFYTSIDIRNAGFKISPVDTNLFPAGFNNLNPAFEPLCVQAMQLVAEQLPVSVNKILIIPESHSRNEYYFKHLSTLQSIIIQAGLDVRTGSLDTAMSAPKTIDTGEKKLTLYPITRNQDLLSTDGFQPDMILLNNDLAKGIPAILQNIKQPITPNPNLGWSHRLKSAHFRHYQKIATEFADLVGLDPWLINPLFRNCGEVDFMQRDGLECLCTNTDAILREIQQKYDEYQVKNTPFVFIKADAGTYGMGVMTVRDSAELKELNRKQRTRMATTKDGKKVQQVIIQEGVYTHETWKQTKSSAEPVVYCIGHHVIGGFYRVHPSRSHDENLNAPGMHFERLAFADCCISPNPDDSQDTHINRFYLYGVIARLALLAASLESTAKSLL